MGMYTGLRFKGTVKEKLRKDFNSIAMSGEWSDSTDKILANFGEVSRASFIPCGSLAYMPDSWDNEDKIERFYDVKTGYWTFQCSLKNYEDTIEFFLELVPYFTESVEYCEVFYEEWTFSARYELIDGVMKMTNDKFVKYGYDDDDFEEGFVVTEVLPDVSTKVFRYYWYDSRRSERVVGIVYANSIEDARTRLQKVYKYIMPSCLDIEEIKFSLDGHCEVYYGG